MTVIWQIAAGDKEKDLVPTMLENGVMIIGPGRIRDITSPDNDKLTIEKKLLKNGQPKNDAGSLIAFRDKAKEGAIVVLRLGSVCFAVGVIAGKYKWDNKYKEVCSYWNRNNKYDSEIEKKEEGWDLQHTREVAWYVLKDNDLLSSFL